MWWITIESKSLLLSYYLLWTIFASQCFYWSIVPKLWSFPPARAAYAEIYRSRRFCWRLPKRNVECSYWRSLQASSTFFPLNLNPNYQLNPVWIFDIPDCWRSTVLLFNDNDTLTLQSIINNNNWTWITHLPLQITNCIDFPEFLRALTASWWDAPNKETPLTSSSLIPT